MNKESQNVVLVALAIILVFTVVLGGGYWYLNYGDSLFEKSNTSNETIVPKKKDIQEGEFALPNDDPTVVSLTELLPNYKSKSMTSEENLYKVAYARNVVTKKDDIINIYEYYIYKETIMSDTGTAAGYKYYADSEKVNLITESIDNLDEVIFDTYGDAAGMYKYSFIKDKTNEQYVFEKVEKIK